MAACGSDGAGILPPNFVPVAPHLATDGRITFATVDLSQADHDEYYVGYANSTLWPLLHYQLGLMAFHGSQFQGYMRVNAYLAKKTLLPLLGPDDIIWVTIIISSRWAWNCGELGAKNVVHRVLPAEPIRRCRQAKFC